MPEASAKQSSATANYQGRSAGTRQQTQARKEPQNLPILSFYFFCRFFQDFPTQKFHPFLQKTVKIVKFIKNYRKFPFFLIKKVRQTGKNVVNFQ